MLNSLLIVSAFPLLIIFVVVGVAFLNLLERRILVYIHIRMGSNINQYFQS